MLAALALSVALDTDVDGQQVVRVAGAQGNIALYRAEQAASLPALLGESKRDGDGTLFTPRFPLQPGRYRVEVAGAENQTLYFEVRAASAKAPTTIDAVYPSSDALPENQLKIYVHFSAPMRRGESYQHIRLLDDQGRVVANPFLELDEELWDAEQRRFTLLFDPGRVKRDLVPNVENGAPLKVGQRYTLVIDHEWRDGNGAPLQREYRKSFRVIAADRSAPDPKAWRLLPPRIGTSLMVEFPEPMDRGLLQRTLSVYRGQQHIVGEVLIDNQEQRWRFTPDEPWRAGEYRLLIDTSLEDLAGNRIGRLFDVDTRATHDEANRSMRPTVELTFAVSVDE